MRLVLLVTPHISLASIYYFVINGIIEVFKPSLVDLRSIEAEYREWPETRIIKCHVCYNVSLFQHNTAGETRVTDTTKCTSDTVLGSSLLYFRIMVKVCSVNSPALTLWF